MSILCGATISNARMKAWFFINLKHPINLILELTANNPLFWKKSQKLIPEVSQHQSLVCRMFQ